jgi:tetratricopeptide (TPR) repeat protein
MNKYIVFFFVAAACTYCSCTNNSGSAENNSTVAAAEKELRNLIAEYPDSLLLKEKLIQYFRDNSNYGQAIVETDYAIIKDSSNERLWYIKATLLSENDDTLQAIKAWEKTIHINPNPEYLLSLGTLYAFTKNQSALSVADSLMLPGANAKNQALFIKGLYYNSTGDKIKAVHFFDTCISLDYTYTLAYREKAICLYDLEKYPDALKVLELAMAVKKDYDEAYYWMGRCYEKLGLKKEAIQNYQQALQLSPDYIEAKDALGKLGIKTP